MFGASFPFFVIGMTSLAAGILCIVLPETKDKKLPNTLEEVAQLQDAKKNKTEVEYPVIEKPIHHERVNLLTNEV